MNRRTSLAALAGLGLGGAVSLLPRTARAAGKGGVIAAPVTGIFTDSHGGTGTFAGTIEITNFTSVGNSLAAVGTLTGKMTDSTGKVLGSIKPTTIDPTATASAASCTILTLVLGPLDLNLLGLVVHLNQVVLTITGQQGAGDLLGNLLCGLANLLNGGGTLDQILADLNSLLGLFGSL